MQFARLGVGSVPAAEVGQAQGDLFAAGRRRNQAVLDAQGECGAVGTQAGPVTVLGFQRTSGSLVRLNGGQVEAWRQLGEGASPRGLVFKAEQGGGGRVQAFDHAVGGQHHHRHRGQGGVQDGVLGGQFARQIAALAVLGPEGPAQFGQDPGYAGEQGGVGQGIGQALARHPGQVDGDGQGDSKARGGAPRQHGREDDRRHHGQVIELTQALQQTPEADSPADRDGGQHNAAPPPTRDGVRERQKAIHRRLNGLSPHASG